MARGLAIPPSAVTHESLVRWFAENTQWKRETRRGYRNSVSSFFQWAHKQGRLTTNPAEELPIVKADQPAPRPAPDRVWREALMRAEPRVMIMLRLAAEAGLRRAEVSQVHTRDLLDGFDGYTLLVHGKGEKQRIVPITDDLAALVAAGAVGHTPELAAYGLTEGWLFPGDENGHLSARWVGKLCSAAMPEGWTMHTLRHRFATKAYRGSRNIRAVQKLLGHSSVAVTERYTAVDESEVRAAMLAASDGEMQRMGLRTVLSTAITASAATIVAASMLLYGAAEKQTTTADTVDTVVCWTENNRVTLSEAMHAARSRHMHLEVGACSGQIGLSA